MRTLSQQRMNEHGVTLTTLHNAMVPIIKPVGDFCNLRCNYCFYNVYDQSTRHKMSLQLLEKLIAEYFEIFSGSLDFVWHGGEPLLAGMPFFEEVVALQAKYKRSADSVRNMVQTNGTLVGDNWARFFKDHAFKVGVSIDGCNASHDRFRKSRGGRATSGRVLDGVEALRRQGIEPGFIHTVTRSSLSRTKEDFDFFVTILNANGWGLNAYLDIDAVNEAMLAQSISSLELTEFLLAYVEMWIGHDDPTIRVREIENFMSGVMGTRSQNCSFNGSCSSFFCVDFNGEVFPCDRSSHRRDLMFGDLSQKHLREVLNSPARVSYACQINQLHPDCNACEWRNACHNGCTMHRSGGVGGKYFYCDARKALFADLSRRVEDFRSQLSTTPE